LLELLFRGFRVSGLCRPLRSRTLTLMPPLPPSPPLCLPFNAHYTSTTALLYYSIVAIVLAYVVGFSIVLKKGYQASTPAAGSVAVKVKGVSVKRQPGNVAEPFVLYDATDLTVYDNGGVFIATNIMRTEQARGRCLGTYHDEACIPGGPDVNNCTEGFLSRTGMQTGHCNASKVQPGMHRCEVIGWCPGEPEEDEISPLGNVGNFTLFLRTNVKFPGMQDADGKTLEFTNANGTVPTFGWNLFSLNDILGFGGIRYEDIQATGADVVMNIYFDCDLDLGMEKCGPRLPFEVVRLDTPNSELSRGYNMRWLSAVSFVPDVESAPDAVFDVGGDTRAVVKAFGPRIRVQITGQGRRWDLMRLTTTLGAGLALLGVATLVVDLLLLYVLPLKHTYQGLKYQMYGAEEEEGVTTGSASEEEPLLGVGG